MGYHLANKSDVLGVGLNCGRPSEDTLGPGLDDQYTAELYYRWQALKVLTITPELHRVVNPALNPEEDQLWILGLRARLAF